MKRIRYRIIDVLVVLTIVSFVFGANAVGFRMSVPHLSIPRFLAGDLDSYYYTSVVVIEPEKSKHKYPQPSIGERFRIFVFGGAPPSDEKYAIRQLGTGQYKSTRRFGWLRLSYDIFLTVLTSSIVVVFAREMRRVRQSYSKT